MASHQLNVILTLKYTIIVRVTRVPTGCIAYSADTVYFASSSFVLYTTQQHGCCRNHDLHEVITVFYSNTAQMSVRGLKYYFGPVDKKYLIAKTAGGACTGNKLDCNEAA